MEQSAQAVEHRVGRRERDRVPPRSGGIERSADLARATGGDLVAAALVAALPVAALGEVEADAARGPLQLAREVTIVASQHGDDGAQFPNEVEADVVSNEHGISDLERRAGRAGRAGAQPRRSDAQRP
ncbi:MAG TPA: hypothetical protein VHE35_08915 [Kofleriaceae bacterium]|nr:hypothetical protein [Kofleriaceae bacterium]